MRNEFTNSRSEHGLQVREAKAVLIGRSRTVFGECVAGFHLSTSGLARPASDNRALGHRSNRDTIFGTELIEYRFGRP